MAATEIDAIDVKCPEPPDRSKSEPSRSDRPGGVRIGIIARPDEDEAWRIAIKRFPKDRAGQLTHQLAMKASDSKGHKRISEIGKQPNGRRETYWLHPFENYKTFTYLVGSYEKVATELARFIEAYILDIPVAGEEFNHIKAVLELASSRANL